jgi:hypothetical protein
MELQKLIDGLKAHKSGAASYESVDEAIRAFEAMRDVDGEKVVKGLICHVFGHPHTRCHKCPYWGTGPHGSSECNVLANDALSLIRQQQERIKELEAGQTARVLTLEEAKTLNHNTVVWYENKSVHPPRPRVVHYANDDHITFTDGSTLNFEMDGYGSHWRCWTQRPTDEQREKVKWE